MKIATHIPIMAKLTVFALLALVFSQPASGQEYTAKDSADFQQMLKTELPVFDRIDYQLRLAEYSIRKPGSFKIDLDKAQSCIDKAIKLNVQLKSREAEGHILFEQVYLQQEHGTSPGGKAMCEQAISLLKNGKDKCLLGMAYKQLANYYNMGSQADLTQKIALINQAVNCFKQCDNKIKTAATLQYLADLYTTSTNYALVLKTVKESLEIYQSINYPRTQGLYDLLGETYDVQDDYTNGLKYESIALKISEQLKDSSMQACEINNHLGAIMMHLAQFKNALVYFSAAQLIAKKHNDVNSVFITSVNLINTYSQLRRPKDELMILDELTSKYRAVPKPEFLQIRLSALYLNAYIQSNIRSQAQIYGKQLLNFTQSPTVKDPSLNDCYVALTSYYFATKDYGQELIFLKKNKAILDKWHIASRQSDNEHMWYKMDSARSDFKLAFFHLFEYKRLGDSLFNEKKSKQIAQIQIDNETQQKDDEIRLKRKDIKILNQNAKINEADLKGARLTRNVTLGGVMAFVLITGMQYRRYREKQRLNLLITNKNVVLQRLVVEKEWLLKEVHHRVKNNLHTVICLLESQAAYLENDALKAVESSQHRIFAMSLIHQRLYQSTDIQTIDMAIYLPEFIMYLKESFGEPANIHFQQEIESIRLDVSQAIPLALIVNEAVTNAIKYAFPEDRTGAIKISLSNHQDLIRLVIEDNGIGLPADIDPDELNTLGLSLIRGLTDDLKGNAGFIIENGTKVIVSFKTGPFNILE